MKKLLVFHPALAPYKVDFFNALSERFDLTVVFQARNLSSQQFDQDKMASQIRFKACYLPHTVIRGGRKYSRGYARILREIRPDIVVGSEFGPNLVIPFVLRPFFRRKYRIWTITDDSVDTIGRGSRLRPLLRGFFTPRLDGMAFSNPSVRDWYLANYSLRSTALAPVIGSEEVLREKVRSCLPLAPELVRRYGLDGHPVVLFVGRLDPVKNLPLLLEAFARVRAEARLVLVGSGEERESLERQAEGLGLQDRVVFAGRWESPELYQWYQIGDVKVLPSRSETFGAVVGEALQTGCPVVCSDAAGAACLIRPGVNGEIVDHTSAESIAGAIETILDRADAGRDLSVIRPSLMEYTFSQYIDSLTDAIQESLR